MPRMTAVGTAVADSDAPEREKPRRDHWWSRKPRDERRPVLSWRLLWNPFEFRHPAMIAVGFGVLAVVFLGLLGSWLLLLNRDTRPKSVQEAVEDFRQGGTSDGGTVALRPSAGVYTYEGSGKERIDVPPASHSQGPEIPATVTHDDNGCWTFKIDYSVDHWQDYQYCSRDGTLTELGGRTFQRWNFVATSVDNLSTFECDPAAEMVRTGMEPGDTWEQSCAGTSNQVSGTVVSAGPVEYVGEETLEVGGESVRAYHLHRERELSGAQTGEDVVDFWFAVDNGLPLRNERSITAHSGSPIGIVTFTEEGDFMLSSLTPRQ